jgi:hypothetical protein
VEPHVRGFRITIGLRGLGAALVIAACRGRRQSREDAELRDLRISRKLGGTCGGRSLEDPPDFERVVDGFHGHSRHEIAVAHDPIQIPLLPEPRETFAHGCPAHAVLAGEHDFRQRRSGRIPPFHDAGLDVLIRPLDLRGLRALCALHVYGKYTDAPRWLQTDSLVLC